MMLLSPSKSPRQGQIPGFPRFLDDPGRSQLVVSTKLRASSGCCRGVTEDKGALKHGEGFEHIPGSRKGHAYVFAG